MPEWWTYTLADFLMFSPRTYYRMIERYNAAVWPAQLGALAVGLGLLATLRGAARARGRAVAAILALLWLWVAWAFLFQRYARINWAAEYAGWLFVLEVVLLAFVAARAGSHSARPGRTAARVGGAVLFGAALLLYPLLAPLLGRGWPAAEVFGLAPDPTVLGTVGILLATGMARALLVVPLLWCLASGATLLAMGSPECWLLLAAVPAALLAGTRPPRQP